MSKQGESPALPGTGEGLSDQGRIPFRLRIGVTGHRQLQESDELRKAVSDAVDLAICRSGYHQADHPNTPLRLTVVSALAEGADRLVANEVLQRKDFVKSRLICVLPVAEENLNVYRADFESEESRQKFNALYISAWQVREPPTGLVPPEASKEQREAGYLWAGQEVVRNSDVVIALWDGQASRGTGGTADLIRWMREQAIRYVSSDPSRATRPWSARAVLGSALFGPPRPEESVVGAYGPLRIIVKTNAGHQLVVDEESPYDLAAGAAQKRLKGDLERLGEFNSKSSLDMDRSAAPTINLLAPTQYQEAWPRLNRIVEQIGLPLNRADQAAMDAQRNFVSSSYGLFGCTALATIIAALQAVVFPGLWELTIGELVLLIAAVAILYRERVWKNNNKHWFVYRFLAERLRSAFYLLAVGCLPDTEFEIGGTEKKPGQHDWVRRAFMAVLAEGDIRQQTLGEDPETLSSLIRGHWISGQVDYFDRTSKKLMRKHYAVRRLLYTVLGATIIAAVLHSLRIWPFHSGNTQALVMCAIGLPAVAGVLSNVRSIREFRKHSYRYARMAAILRWYLQRSDDASDIDHLRGLAIAVDDLLTEELTRWLDEVSSQGLEPG
jgi:hypothetical protein